METLVNDFRFTLYNVCYKRVLLVWVVFAFCVLLGLLFSGLRGIPLFSLGVGWLFLNAAAIFMCMWVKLRLARGLERCLASVNKQLIRHKIILALDDRGRISCHKVNLCFLYYDPEQCVSYLNDFIERSEQNGNTIQAGWESRLDVDVNDIVIQGSSTTRVSKRKVRILTAYDDPILLCIVQIIPHPESMHFFSLHDIFTIKPKSLHLANSLYSYFDIHLVVLSFYMSICRLINNNKNRNKCFLFSSCLT